MSTYPRLQAAMHKLQLIFGGPVDPVQAIDKMAQKIVLLNAENEMYEQLLAATSFDLGMLEGCATADDVAIVLSLPRPTLAKDAPKKVQQPPPGLIIQ